MISKHQDHKFNACKDVAVYHTKEKQKQKNRDESFKNKQNYVAIKTEFLSQYYLEVCDASFSLEICIILAIWTWMSSFNPSQQLRITQPLALSLPQEWEQESEKGKLHGFR